jgi:hypothetical protein
LFDEVVAREFGDFRYARAHRLTVDTYSLQHPHEYMQSAKSFAAHLTGLCAALDRDDAIAVNRAVVRWLDGAAPVGRPEDVPPLQRGALTIVHLHTAADPEEHVTRVLEWAQSTWIAWDRYHPLAHEWIEKALKASESRLIWHDRRRND